MKSIPYVAADRSVQRGTLVTPLELAGDRTVSPVANHKASFTGDHPCDDRGSRLKQIQHNSQRRKISAGVVVQHQFSAKPTGGYANYYEKMTAYAKVISKFAQRIQPGVTARTYAPVACTNDEDVFAYLDTASSRAEIDAVSNKLRGQQIAIIGLGGTGAYILDLVAKTPVDEIRLIDGDRFYSHNAFRSPGAATLEELRAAPKKVDYLRSKYSAMHRRITAVPEYMTEENIDCLDGVQFVFLSLDDGEAKRIVMNTLIEAAVPFIDCGIGVTQMDENIRGQLRVTTATPDWHEHITGKIPTGSVENDNAYVTNIQIAELNSMCASIAVIRWKKWLSFYADLEQEHHTLYVIDGNCIHNDNAKQAATELAS
jgi:molybdopterin/thiamine biosynthesis adenylyltransferase